MAGHISDAILKYQQTSDKQCMNLSKIIHYDVEPIKLSQVEGMEVV